MEIRINSKDCTGSHAAEVLRKNWNKAKEDSARPRYHFCPMAGWMNDPNGAIYENGTFHFFYLQDPFDASGFSECSFGRRHCSGGH